MGFLTRTLRDDRGQGMTEYMIIAILIALVVLFAFNKYGAALYQRMTAATNTVGTVNVTDTEGEIQALEQEADQ